MIPDNVLDSLFSPESDSPGNRNIISEEIVIPKRCALCKTAMICSILPTFINFSKIKIYVSLEQCPYHQPFKKNNESK